MWDYGLGFSSRTQFFCDAKNAKREEGQKWNFCKENAKTKKFEKWLSNTPTNLSIYARFFADAESMHNFSKSCSIHYVKIPISVQKVNFDKILFDFLTKCGLLEYCNPKGIWESWFVWKLKVFSAWCQLPFSATPPQKRQNILIYQFIQLAFRI